MTAIDATGRFDRAAAGSGGGTDVRRLIGGRLGLLVAGRGTRVFDGSFMARGSANRVPEWPPPKLVRQREGICFKGSASSIDRARIATRHGAMHIANRYGLDCESLDGAGEGDGDGVSSVLLSRCSPVTAWRMASRRSIGAGGAVSAGGAEGAAASACEGLADSGVTSGGGVAAAGASGAGCFAFLLEGATRAVAGAGIAGLSGTTAGGVGAAGAAGGVSTADFAMEVGTGAGGHGSLTGGGGVAAVGIRTAPRTALRSEGC